MSIKRKLKRAIKKAAPLIGLAGGLALLNKGKGMEMSNISVDSGRGGDSASAMARSIANRPEKVFQDDIMRGGSGVKFMPKRNPKSIRVEGEPIRPFGFMFKKGGRVKKGFAKKKKQANKMRKK